MTPPSSSSADLDNPAARRAEDAAYYRRVLHAMIDVGVELVRQLPEPVQPEDEVVDLERSAAYAADRSLAYDRLTRAVRRSILLAQSIAERPEVPDARAAGRVERRRRILREVEDLIHKETGGERGELLHDELLERLDSPEMEESLDDRPVEEIITELRRDLGLGSLTGRCPWKRRTPEDVAELHARAAKAAVLAEAPPAMRGQLVAMLGLGDREALRHRAAIDTPDG